VEFLKQRLFGPRIPLPDLPELLIHRAEVRRCVWIPWIGGHLSGMKQSAAGVAIGNQILLAPGVILSHRLLIHELEHVKQWQAEWLFLVWYTLESLRHGYYNNRYEVAARAAEAQSRPGVTYGVA